MRGGRARKAARSTSAELRDAAFGRAVASIPRGKVATYGQVASAAGYPRYHRAVARFLQGQPPNRLPWQRVLGAGGEIKLRSEAAAEQRLRLQMEGVSFRGHRVNMALHQHHFQGAYGDVAVRLREVAKRVKNSHPK